MSKKFLVLGRHDSLPCCNTIETTKEGFSLKYTRKKSTRILSSSIEDNILKELEIDKRNIEDSDVPL
jgi:hypothetical protein